MVSPGTLEGVPQMAKKTLIIAKFADGTINTRKTTSQTLSFAWRVTNKEGDVIEQGFAGRRDLADRAVAQVVKRAIMSNEGRRGEIVKTEIAPEGFEKQLLAKRPFRIWCTYDNRAGGSYVTGSANKTERWETRAAAEAWIAKNKDKPFYRGRALEVIEDEKRPLGFRVRRRFGEKAAKFVTGGGRSHLRFDNREAAQAYIDDANRDVPNVTYEIVED
jgi:hypothetical protein